MVRKAQLNKKSKAKHHKNTNTTKTNISKAEQKENIKSKHKKFNNAQQNKAKQHINCYQNTTTKQTKKKTKEKS